MEHVTCKVCGQTDIDSFGKCVHCGAPLETEEENMNHNIVNLTPHTINLYDNNETIHVLEIEPSGIVARCAEIREQLPTPKWLAGFPIARVSYGAVEGLPEPVDGTIYIVSALVLNALAGSGRNDVYAPGVAVRDVAGRVIGCIGFSALPEPKFSDELLETVYGIEYSAADSYGYGSWLTYAVRDGKGARTPFEQCVGDAVREYLDRKTPQVFDLGQLPPQVHVEQIRIILTKTLEVKIRVDDGTGDWRDAVINVHGIENAETGLSAVQAKIRELLVLSEA